jgi:hypothetical protein
MDVPQRPGPENRTDRAYLEHCRSIQERIVQSVFGNHYQTVAYYNH